MNEELVWCGHLPLGNTNLPTWLCLTRAVEACGIDRLGARVSILALLGGLQCCRINGRGVAVVVAALRAGSEGLYRPSSFSVEYTDHSSREGVERFHFIILKSAG